MRSFIRNLAIIPTYFFVNSVFSAIDSSSHTTTSIDAAGNTVITTTTVIPPKISNRAFLPVSSEPLNDTIQFHFNPWPIRATGWILGGDRNVNLGDAMWPILGNDNGMLYADGQAKYATDSDWVTSIGTGIRQIYNDARILGAYVFLDHNEFKNLGVQTSHFDMISPGIESLGNVWDFRINGYIPISRQSVLTGTAPASQMGNSNFVQFSGHTEFDQLINSSANSGPGIDGEIGHAIPVVNNFRVFLGGYYFSPKNSTNIRGIEARTEFPINHFFALTAADSYDNNQHNSFEAGLRLTLGGIRDDQTCKDITRRIVDPLSRNLATLSQGIGAPATTSNNLDGQIILRNNIYFFSASANTPAPLVTATQTGVGATQNGLLGATTSNFNPAAGTANCTFEHPCSGTSFTQATVNSINTFAPGANFYLNTGVYSLNGQMFLNNGQSIYGRSLDYIQAANGTEQPQLIGALQVLSNNTLDSFIMLNNGAQTTAIVDQNANNIFFNNLNIGALNATQGYRVGIEVDNGSLQLTNSVINAFANDSNAAEGINGGGLAGSTGNVTLLLGNNTFHTVTADLAGGSGIFFRNITGDVNLTANNNYFIISTPFSAQGIAVLNIAGNINAFLNGNRIEINENSSIGGTMTASGVNLATGTIGAAPNKADVTLNTHDNVILINSIHNSNSLGSTVVGIEAQAASNSPGNVIAVLNNDTIDVNATVVSGSLNVFGFAGINNSADSTVNNNLATFNGVNITANGNTGNGTVAGIELQNSTNSGNNVININNSIVNATGTALGAITVTGILGNTTGVQGTNILTVINSFITATANVGVFAQARAVDLEDLPSHNQLTITNSRLLAFQNGISVPAVFINGNAQSFGLFDTTMQDF